MNGEVFAQAIHKNPHTEAESATFMGSLSPDMVWVTVRPWRGSRTFRVLVKVVRTEEA